MHHSALDREKGYIKIMQKSGRKPTCLTVETKDVAGLDVALSADDWRAISQHDAVIAYDDDLANLIARTAYDHQVRIPDGLAIAGFNGDYASLSAWQRLTTMQIPTYEMGRKAAEMAFELVSKGVDAALPSVVFRPNLILGQTT